MHAFGRIHPCVSALYFTSVIIPAMFIQNPILAVMALTGAVMFCICTDNIMLSCRECIMYSAVFFIITLTNPLFSHSGKTLLFYLWDIAFTLESFIYGASLGITVTAVMIWFKCLNSVMDDEKIMYLFGRRLPKFALLLSMTLRFIPDMSSKIKKVSRAQKAIGKHNGGILNRIHSAIKIFSVSVSWMLENGIETTMSMNARGYSKRGRVSASVHRLTVYEIWLITIISFLFAMVMVAVIIGGISFEFYPQISIGSSYTSFYFYACYAALALLPSYIQIKEKIRWKYLMSKI